MSKKLSKEDKKQIKEVLAKHKPTKKKQKSAQESVPYEKVFKDGICKVTSDYFSKTILFEDINYQLAEDDDKTAIFEGWCNFLNYFDTTISFQFSFLNITGNEKTFSDSISIQAQNDDFNSIRDEYGTMLKSQLAKGNNGLIKRKYLTFGVNADTYKKAKVRLEQIESHVYNNFKKLGVNMQILDGKDRLNLFHNMLHMNENTKFAFDWDWLPPTGLSTKDFIIPSSFYFGDGKKFKSGDKFGSTAFFQILAPELSDRVLADFLEIEANQNIAMHVKSIDHIKAIKMIKRKLTDLEKTKIDEQKKAVRSGYDMDTLPASLEVNLNETKRLLQDLNSRNERLFYFTFLVTNVAETKSPYSSK